MNSVLKMDERTFNKNCKELGINYPNFRKRKVNYNPFQNINDPQVQYWLGWLATDGHISKKENRITLLLSIKDIDVIEKFRHFVSDKLTICYSIHHKKFEMVAISFRNKDIVDYLYKLGFSDNKTFNFIPKFKISWDYIRGVFEGDGYLRFNKNSREINITSACKEHIDYIYEFVKSFNINCYIRTFSTKLNTTMYNLEIYNIPGIIKFLNYIYKDADIFMNRKYQNARIVRNSNWKGLKFGEPTSGIPSQALKKEGVTT